MNWSSVNFDWNRARAFLVTAEEGSLSAAAAALGLAQPTLGRQVRAFEEELGVVLFERSGRGLALTPGGLELLDYVRRMAQAASELSLVSAGQTQNLEGNVCISTSEIYAVHALPRAIAAIRESHPGIRVELVASNSSSDLKKREADIAVRSFRPTQSDLIGKKLRSAQARLYASPAYLETLGEELTLESLNEAAFVGFDHSDTLMQALNGAGMTLSQSNFPLLSSNHLALWQMVREGLGIGIVDEWIGDRDPQVVRVHPDAPAIEFPVWLVCHRELQTSRRIRAVFDILAETLFGEEG